MDYKATLQRAAEKFRASAALAAAEGLIPYKSENGRWIPSPYDGNSWWTGGFWPGLMWQFYAATGDEAFLREARRTEELLTAEFRRFTYLNHDVGFMYLLSCGAERHQPVRAAHGKAVPRRLHADARQPEPAH